MGILNIIYDNNLSFVHGKHPNQKTGLITAKKDNNNNADTYFERIKSVKTQQTKEFKGLVRRAGSYSLANYIFHMSSITQHWLTPVPVGLKGPFNWLSLMGWQIPEHLNDILSVSWETGHWWESRRLAGMKKKNG